MNSEGDGDSFLLAHNILTQSISRVYYTKAAAINGIREESNTKDLYINQLKELNSALDFLRKTKNIIVSLNELRNIKEDIEIAERNINALTLTIKRLERVVKDQERELELCNKKLEQLKTINRKGILLSFPGKDSNGKR